MKKTVSIALALSAAAYVVAADILLPNGSGAYHGAHHGPVAEASTVPLTMTLSLFGALAIGAFFLIRWILRKIRKGKKDQPTTTQVKP